MPFPMSVEAKGKSLTKESWDKEIHNKAHKVAEKLGKRKFWTLFNYKYQDKNIEIHYGYTSMESVESKILWKGKLVYKQGQECTWNPGVLTIPSLYIDRESGWIEYLDNLYNPIIHRGNREKNERTKKRFGL